MGVLAVVRGHSLLSFVTQRSLFLVVSSLRGPSYVRYAYVYAEQRLDSWHCTTVLVQGWVFVLLLSKAQAEPAGLSRSLLVPCNRGPCTERHGRSRGTSGADGVPLDLLQQCRGALMLSLLGTPYHAFGCVMFHCSWVGCFNSFRDLYGVHALVRACSCYLIFIVVFDYFQVAIFLSEHGREG